MTHEDEHRLRLPNLRLRPQLPARIIAVPAALALAAAVLAACGGSPTPGTDVTVTVTPTVKVTSKGSTPTAADETASDDKGRAYDFGVVTQVREVQGITVLELDRWTWKGLDDAALASRGIPAAHFTGKVPYENQNAKLTYTLPVADGARLLYHHCVAADQPLQTKSVSADGLKGLAARENTVVVKLDDQGRVTAADNVPGCPG